MVYKTRLAVKEIKEKASAMMPTEEKHVLRGVASLHVQHSSADRMPPGDYPNFEWQEDYVDKDGERRYQGFGLLPNLKLLMIAFVIRSNSDGREYLWPISVRDATDYEEDHYYGR